MRNVTIALEEQVAQWLRIEAAKRGSSVSRLVGEMLRNHMRAAESYEAARRQFFAVEPQPLRRRRVRQPSREERQRFVDDKRVRRHVEHLRGSGALDLARIEEARRPRTGR